ncbi:MAG: Asp23/Gls24 family envelope stress response protein [Filifactoraceae bacterium]
MLSSVSNEYGNIFISKETIAKIAGLAAMECYGLVGMANREKKGIVELLTSNNSTKGIVVDIKEEGIILGLYVIIQYGTRISTVADNIIDRVKYYVEKQTGMKVAKINVYIKGVRVHK